MCSDRSSAGQITVTCDPFRAVLQKWCVYVCVCVRVRIFVDKYMCVRVCLCVLLDRVRVKYGLGRRDEGAGTDR